MNTAKFQCNKTCAVTRVVVVCSKKVNIYAKGVHNCARDEFYLAGRCFGK